MERYRIKTSEAVSVLIPYLNQIHFRGLKHSSRLREDLRWGRGKIKTIGGRKNLLSESEHNGNLEIDMEVNKLMINMVKLNNKMKNGYFFVSFV